MFTNQILIKPDQFIAKCCINVMTKGLFIKQEKYGLISQGFDPNMYCCISSEAHSPSHFGFSLAHDYYRLGLVSKSRDITFQLHTGNCCIMIFLSFCGRKLVVLNLNHTKDESH